MSTAMRLYQRLPVALQNVACSLAGAHIQWTRYAGSFARHLAEIKAYESLSDEAMKAEQHARLWAMIQYAYRNVPYYREAWGDKFDPDAYGDVSVLLGQLPLLTRSEVKRQPERFLSQRYRLADLVPYPTGGTSGSPLVLRFTHDQIRHNFAFAEARIRNWGNVTFRSHQATFLGKRIVAADQNKGPYWRSNWAGNQKLFSIFHLTRVTAAAYMAEMEHFAPDLVVGYVTPLYTLAKYMLEAGRTATWGPKLVWTSSETLLDSQRAVIEAAFGCRVCNAYSGAEGVALITQCESGGLHVSPDFGYVEFIPLNDGSGLCELVGTTLFNWSMPLIRYRTGDLVERTVAECGCGCRFPLVKRIVGRLDDTVETPSGASVSSAPLSLVFQDCPGVDEAQLVQVGRAELLVRVVPSGTPGKVPVDSIVQGLQARIGEAMDIRVDIVDTIERSQGGKFRFIVRQSDWEARR